MSKDVWFTDRSPALNAGHQSWANGESYVNGGCGVTETPMSVSATLTTPISPSPIRTAFGGRRPQRRQREREERQRRRHMTRTVAPAAFPVEIAAVEPEVVERDHDRDAQRDTVGSRAQPEPPAERSEREYRRQRQQAAEPPEQQLHDDVQLRIGDAEETGLQFVEALFALIPEMERRSERQRVVREQHGHTRQRADQQAAEHA